MATVSIAAFLRLYIQQKMSKTTKDPQHVIRPKKYFSKYKKPLVEFPNLIEHQVQSYNWLIEKGIKEVFKEFTPIQDYSAKKFQLDFVSFHLVEPKFDENYAKENKLSFDRFSEDVKQRLNEIIC